MSDSPNLSPLTFPSGETNERRTGVSEKSILAGRVKRSLRVKLEIQHERRPNGRGIPSGMGKRGGTFIVTP